MDDFSKAVELLEERSWEVRPGANYDGFLCWYSPKGEQIYIEAESLETLEDLKDAFNSEWDAYDIDEHIDLWAPYRGTHGVPSSYEALLDDADAIGKELESCVRLLRTI